LQQVVFSVPMLPTQLSVGLNYGDLFIAFVPANSSGSYSVQARRQSWPRRQHTPVMRINK
jgi:hypothetical protein